VPSPEEERARLEQAVATAVAGGDHEAAAEAHGALSTLLFLQGDAARAEWHLTQAIGQCRRLRRLDLASRYTRLLGQLRASQGRAQEAAQAFTDAFAQGQMGEAPLEALQATVRHADLLAQGGLHEQAVGVIDLGLSYAMESDLPGEVAALMQQRSRHLLSMGQVDRALDVLGVALEASQLTDDIVQQVRLRWARHQLERGLGRPTTESLLALRGDVEPLDGLDDIQWELDLTEASLRLQQGDDLDKAAVLTRSARDGALARRELPTYLQACLLLADIEVASDRRHAALLVLLTCHRTVANLLDEEAAAPVKAMLERYRRQWGPQAYDQAFQRLRDHMEAQRPQNP